MKKLLLLLASLVLFAAACSEDPATLDTPKPDDTPKDTVVVEPVAVEEIVLETNRIELEVGDSAAIVATVLPEEARADNPLTFTSRNPEIATVSESGMVTGVGAGETKIDVKAGGLGVVCHVEVKEAKGVTFSGTVASEITFSTATLSATLKAVGLSEQNTSAAFYYMETNENPTAAELKEKGKRSVHTMVWIPGSGEVSAKISGLAVNTRYCYVAATDPQGEYYYGEVKSFTTADLPEMPEVTDMGLSVKWCGWNVGASKPEEAGGFYSWAEITPKDDYRWENYKYGTSYTKVTKYVTSTSNPKLDNKLTLEAEDDAATMNLGSPWRMPTDDEMTELLNKTTKKWTRYKGVYGIVMTSTVNDAVLFFPAAGYCSVSSPNPSHAGVYGQYWTSCLNQVSDSMAWMMILKERIADIGLSNAAYRNSGFSVRAVQ